MAKALTLLEMIIALSISAVIFAIIPPILRSIRNSWDIKQANAETLQSGTMLIDHLNRNLAKAVRITAVSTPSTTRITAVSTPSITNGYIQFEDNIGNNLRYEVVNNYVQFGVVGNLGDLAGPVSQLRFNCYDSNEVDTPIPDVNDVISIRFVEVEATLTNSSPMGQNETFTTSVYIRTNANIWEEGITAKTPLEFNVFEGREPALAQINNTHYLCAYRGWDWGGRSVVLTVNPTTWVISDGTMFEYDSFMAKTPALSQIDNDNYLCAYEGGNSDGWAVILTVDPIAWMVTKGTPFEFDTQKGETPALSKIDGTHYLCAYSGNGDDGWAVVLTVDTGTRLITKETPYEFDTQKGKTPALLKIDDTHYLCAYEGKDSDGWVTVLTVNTGTWAITKETPFEFNTQKGKTPALSKIDDTHYLCAYTGNGDDGWATALTVNTSTWAITQGTPFEFDTQKGKTPALSKIDDVNNLCAYTGSGDDGWSVVLVVDPITWTISKGTPLEYDTSKGKEPALEKIDNNYYLCAYQGKNDDGWAVLKVRP
ncbi:MAG: PilW family protein [Planctomycetota bacterium]|jgi:type II secretory pathway component PulJ